MHKFSQLLQENSHLPAVPHAEWCCHQQLGEEEQARLLLQRNLQQEAQTQRALPEASGTSFLAHME